MTSFHLFEFAMVILVGLFWLQIFLRGIARRNFKFEYISYSVIIVCFLEFYFTYVIWQDGKPVLALASYFWIILALTRGGSGLLEEPLGIQWKHNLELRALRSLKMMIVSILKEKD